MSANEDGPVFSEEDHQALMAKLGEPDSKAPEEKPEEKAPEEKEDDKEESEEDKKEDEDKEDNKVKPEETEATVESLKDELAAAGKALLSGDLKELAKALKVDHRATDISNRKLRHTRRSVAEAKGLKSEAEAIKTSAETMKTALRAEYGDVFMGKDLYSQGKVIEAAQFIEGFMGVSFADLSCEILDLQSSDPKAAKPDAALAKRERDLKARERAFDENRKRIENGTNEAQQKQAAMGRLTTELKGHDLGNDPEDVQAVFDLVFASYDAKTKTHALTVKDAADKVLDKAEKRAARLGFEKAATKPGKPTRRLSRPMPKSTKKPGEKVAFSEEDHQALMAKINLQMGSR